MNETETLDNSDDQQPQDINLLRSLVESTNIAEKLDKDIIKDIVTQCADGFENDLRSRLDWEDSLNEWTKLALQVKEEKTFPWVGASNVKYPLVSIASMQFNARAYPSLVPATSSIVKVEVIGKDPDGSKLDKAERIGTFMSYQIQNEMDGWEEDMDKLLIMLPVVGTMFKKTYFDSIRKKNISELILPKNLIVNYWAKNLECAERISERIDMSTRKVKEKQMSGIFLDVPLPEPHRILTDEINNKPIPIIEDETTPYYIVEQHMYYDLDEDGYSEPYIVTFERNSKTLLRMVARYDETTIETNQDGSLAKICPIEYYTKFSFIPNPEGGFYDVGFGMLLSPLNESVNTLINQLIDAGTLSNLQGGFLGKGLKLKMGESRWNPGEWKTVTSTAEDLRKQIVPLPMKEPSNVLFELMQSLITSCKELASVAEIMVGKMPGQNTPATTTMATIEQGMKVFTAVYKRVYRALKCEFKKIFDLNANYLDPNKYQQIVDEPIGPSDFDINTYDVCPGADPNTATQTEKLMKAQGLMELMPMFPGMLDPVKIAGRVLEAQEQPSYQELFSQQVAQTGQWQPPPDPKTQEIQMKGQFEQQKLGLKEQELAFKQHLESMDAIGKQQMAQYAQQHDIQMNQVKGMLDMAMKLHNERYQVDKTMQESRNTQQQHTQQMVHTEQKHTQTMRHQEEKAKLVAQQAKSSKTGAPKK